MKKLINKLFLFFALSALIIAPVSTYAVETTPDPTDPGTSEGENTFVIVVKTKEGKETKYTLKITRATSNLNLKSLKIVGQNINEVFDKDTHEYTSDVTYNVQSVKVQAAAEDDNATVTVLGSSDLNVGRNVVRILVKNQSGESKEYKIIVTRGSEEDLKGDDEGEEVVSSEVEESSSEVVTPPQNNNNNDDPGEGNTLTYILVVILCLLLLAIGIIGIFFYIKTGDKDGKRRQKKLEKLEKKRQKIEEQLTGLMPVINEDTIKEVVKEEKQEEKPEEKVEIVKEETTDDLDDTIEMDVIDFEIEDKDVEKKPKKRVERNVLEDFDDLFLDE